MHGRFKHKITFSSKITKVAGEDINKYVSLASLDRLKPLVPANVDLSKNPDLMCVVLNGAVAGMTNKNSDAITNKTGVDIAKNFVWKLVDVEHDRSSIVGVICNYGFSEYGSNKLLSAEEASNSDAPINLSFALLLYKAILSDSFIEEIEESCNESSPKYGSLSASWELYFNDYDIAVGPIEVSQAQVFTDSEKATYEQHLPEFGGSGKVGDKYVYRVIKHDDYLVPAGIGIVGNPAAIFHKDGGGLLVVNPEKEQNSNESFSEKMDKAGKRMSFKELLEIHNSENGETKSVKEFEPKDFMLKHIKDLTDENLKEVKASVVTDLFAAGLREASDKWEAEKSAKENEIKELAAKQKEATEIADNLKKELEKVTLQLQDLTDKALAKEKQDKFSERMAYFDSEYDLSPEDRGVIVADITDLANDKFEDYSKRMNVLLKDKNKKVVEAKKLETAELEAKAKVSTASVTPVTDVGEAIDAGAKTTVVPNTQTTEVSLADKFKLAFSPENCLTK